MIEPQFTSLSPETPLSSARHVVAGSSDYVFPILDAASVWLAILSKSHFIKPIPRQLILVDHNELSQAVKGVGDLQIIEVLDHHRLASFNTDVPILFWNSPVGSTSTVGRLIVQAARNRDRTAPRRTAHGGADLRHAPTSHRNGHAHLRESARRSQ